MRSKVLHVVMLVSLVLPMRLLAQGVTGTVTSGGGPVVGANVSADLVGADVSVRGIKRGTTTDSQGKYVLELSSAGRYSVRFASVGYTSKTVTITVEATGMITLDVELQESAKQMQEVVAVGGRASTRTVTDSPLPIDVLQARDISSTGQNSFDKMLQYRVPSFNTIQTPVNDATALLDPWEIRNMGVSRTLILINGKRKNLSSLVYTQTSPSRGESGVDLSAIPVDAIKRVEILRDGASAQYGSDAIAGVVNIVLKDDAEAGSVTINTGVTNKGDGARSAISINNGSSIFDNKGFINYTLDLSRVNEARRSGLVDAEGEAGDFGADINDVRAFLAYDKYAGNRNSSPSTSASKFLINMGVNVSDNTELYGNGAYVYKKVNSYANYRTPYWRTLGDFPYLKDFFGDGTPQSYKGYIPTFDGDLIDYNATVGLRAKKGGWNYDASLTLGFNSQDYTVLNSHNRSADTTATGEHVYQENSPINFQPGGSTFSHQVGNIDVSSALTDQLSLGFGTEFRTETFEVLEGDKASWDGVGADSYAGNRPENSGKFSRYNFGGYIDLGFDITRDFLISTTFRNEYYSDFGNAFVFKVSSRVKFLDDRITLRGSYSSGFKAPTLHQIYTQRVQYSFVPGQGIQSIGLINNVSPQARLLGVKPLTPEKSRNLTLGVGAKATENLNITFDYYRITVKDRIVISNRVPFGTSGEVNFFTNSISTITSGLDLVFEYKNIELGSGALGVSLAGNLNLKNERDGNILQVRGRDVIDAEQEALFFTSRPKRKFVLGTSYDLEGVNISLNNTYFGKTEFRQNGLDQHLKTVFDPKVVTDLGVSYNLFSDVVISANVNNLLNVIPKWKFEAVSTDISGKPFADGTAGGQAILNDPAQVRVQRNLVTFNGRYDIETYDGFHFSQLGRIYNLTITYSL